MTKLIKAFIILFSELIWIYYTIALFTKVEWERTLFVNILWWVVAAIVAYGLNRLLAGKIHHIALIVMNGIAITILTIQNWFLVVQDNSFFFGAFISAVIVFIFLRSASLVFKEQMRLHMLHHFEANIIIYVLFAFIFTNNEVFHVVFLCAIFISLIGMVLTIQNYGQDESNSDIEIHKAGNSGWFTAIIGLLLAFVTLASFLLFLPSIRHMLQSLGASGFAGLKWAFNQITAFLVWLFGLFPVPEDGEGIEEPGIGNALPSGEVPEEAVMQIPTSWLIAGTIIISIIIIGVITWIASRFLKRWKPPKSDKVERLFMFDGSLLKQFVKSVQSLFKQIRMRWRIRFSRYYKETVYWYYYKVQCWGKKNGLQQLLTETSKEYIEKVIQALHKQTDKDPLKVREREQLITDLRKLNQDYQAAYYGYQVEVSGTEYSRLLGQLSKLKLNKNSSKTRIQHLLQHVLLLKKG